MPLELFADTAFTTVTSGGTTALTSDNAFTVASSAPFPAASGSAVPPTQFHFSDPAAPSELMACTNVSGTSWTVTRGAEGSTPVAHTAGFTVREVASAGTLGTFQQVYSVRSVLYGAAGNGTTDDTTAIQAAVTACINAGGGIVCLPEGTYKTSSTITAPLPSGVTLTIQGAGWLATTIAYHGSGDCIRMYDPNAYTTNAPISWRSGVTGLCIDGTSASAGAVGLHAGDMGVFKGDFLIQNFSGAGSRGLLLDNTVTWTEEADIRACLINCTQHVVFTITTGYDSFGYGNYDFTIIAETNQQSGVVILNGANVYHGSLRVRGNFTTGASATTAAVLYMAGTAPGGALSGTFAQLNAMHLDICVECAAGSNPPMTIYMDTVNYAFASGCYGQMDFSFGAGTFAHATVAQGQFVFNGIVGGDTALASGGLSGPTGGTWRALNIPAIYTLGATFGAAGNLPTAGGDFFALTLAASTTIVLNPAAYNSGVTLGVPQRVTIAVTQAASGGPWTLAWPATGSPTTAAPNVAWAGGVTPAMSTTASAVDVYLLETSDGAHWYGRAIQQGSVADTEQFTALTAAYTLTNSTSPQQLFNATTNGALTVAGATSYFFESEFVITGLSGSAHTLDFGFVGTATFTSVKYMIDVNNGAAGTLAAWQTAVVTSATATAFTAAGITTTAVQARLRGIIRINAAGTIIPAITQATAAAAGSVSVNSWFRIWPVGSNTVTSTGNWS